MESWLAAVTRQPKRATLMHGVLLKEMNFHWVRQKQSWPRLTPSLSSSRTKFISQSFPSKEPTSWTVRKKVIWVSVITVGKILCVLCSKLETLWEKQERISRKWQCLEEWSLLTSSGHVILTTTLWNTADLSTHSKGKTWSDFRFN